MNAPLHDPTLHGTPETYRRYIGEMLAMAAIQADLGATYANIDDDTGLEYAIRNLAAYVKSAIRILPDLRALKETIRERQQPVQRDGNPFAGEAIVEPEGQATSNAERGSWTCRAR